MNGLFEKATRLGVHYTTRKGIISVEDLWNLPLKSNVTTAVTLDNIAKSLNTSMKGDQEESFVEETPKANPVLETAFEVVKRVIEVKLEERKQRTKAATKKAKKEQILSLIADKENDELRNMSKADLKKLLDGI